MDTMKAAVLHGPGQPLELCELPRPVPGEHDVLVRVEACGVCRTDLHIVDGELDAAYPIIPGHQIVGVIRAQGFGEVEGASVLTFAGESRK